MRKGGGRYCGAEEHDEEGTAGVHDGSEGHGGEKELGDGAVHDDGDGIVDDGLAVAEGVRIVL